MKLPSDVGKTVDTHKCVLKHFWRFWELPLLSRTRRAKPRQNAPERYFCGFYRPGSALSYLQGMYDTMTVPWLDRSICECIALCLWNRNNITGPAEGKQHGTAGRMCHRIAAVRMRFGAHRMVRAGSATKGCFLCCLFLSRLYRAICIYMYCYIPY